MPFAFTGIIKGVDVARSRNIKPGFFCNEMLAELQAFDRLLFIGLWCLADREGRLEDRPKRIKMELFPCDSYDVNEGLEALKGSGFIRRYSFEDFQVVEILNFSKHQNPHGSEKDSILPDDSGFLTVNERIRNVVVSGKARKVHVNETLVNVKPPLENALIPDSGFLIPDSLIPEDKSSCDQQAESPKADRIDYQSVAAAFGEHLHALPQPRDITDKRKRAIRSIVKRGGRYADPAFFAKFFGYVAESDFLMARGAKPWHGCSFDWLLKPDNFQKIIEGNYHGEGNNA
jgi:hypothetical protein